MRSFTRLFLLASSLSLGCLVPLAHAEDPGSTIVSAAGTWRYLPTLPEIREKVAHTFLIHHGD